MANIEDIKKMASENGVEITDEILADVAGGYYSTEEWLKCLRQKDKKQKMIQSNLKSREFIVNILIPILYNKGVFFNVSKARFYKS